MRLSRAVSVALLGLAFLISSSTLFAQTSSAIAGTVRDSSGGVLPGVTVEVSSPALIERMRTATSDEQGQYRIVGLVPGVYSGTFTLVGFTTLKRDGIDLPNNFTASVNAELRVGGLEETITVSGPSPVVDVQNAAARNQITREALDTLVTLRRSRAVLLAGVQMTGTDVGGSRRAVDLLLETHGANFAREYQSDQPSQPTGHLRCCVPSNIEERPEENAMRNNPRRRQRVI